MPPSQNFGGKNRPVLLARMWRRQQFLTTVNIQAHVWNIFSSPHKIIRDGFLTADNASSDQTKITSNSSAWTQKPNGKQDKRSENPRPPLAIKLKLQKKNLAELNSKNRIVFYPKTCEEIKLLTWAKLYKKVTTIRYVKLSPIERWNLKNEKFIQSSVCCYKSLTLGMFQQNKNAPNCQKTDENMNCALIPIFICNFMTYWFDKIVFQYFYSWEHSETTM